MAFVQETYQENIDVAVPGMPADADYSADTGICETAAGIGFGLAVSQGATDKGRLLGGASAAVFAGVSIRDKTVLTEDLYEEGRNMGVMTRGDIWIEVGGDVSAGDDATFAETTGILSSAAPGAAQFAISGARWMTSATSGNLAILRLSGELPSA